MHWRKRVSRGAFLLLVVAATLLPALSAMPAEAWAGPGQRQEQQGLLAPASTPGSIDRSGEPSVLRSRFVEVDQVLSALRSAPHSLALNLFDDVVLTATGQVVAGQPEGDSVWQGQVAGVDMSHVVLVVHDGLLAANVSWPGAFYQVRYAGGGVYAVYEIDQSAFPPEAEPLTPVPPLAGAAPPRDPFAPADSGGVIDVLVVYTPDARAAAGGAAAMQAEVELAVAESNMSYANSQINQRLHLVHAAELAYVETGNLLTDLERLQAPADGYLDTAHTLRNAYAADEVALLVSNAGAYCGMSYLLEDPSATWFEAWSFATIDRDCATGYYSFGHELGHNMGANHDWFVDTSLTPFTYSHGFYNAAGRWRTIMAYADGCLAAGVNCTRIPYWSNPAVYYGGAPLGIAGGTSTSCTTGQLNPGCDADNHRTLNDTAWLVANFRASVATVPVAPSGLSATVVSQSQINLTWFDNSDNELGFTIERSLSGAGGWSQIGSVGPRVTLYSNLGLAAGATYYYRVRAFNVYGNSAYSNVASATIPAIGPLTLDRMVVDDDNLAGTVGDGDGRIECGETIDLWLTLRNEGNYQAESVSASISSSDPYLSFLANTSSSYPPIASLLTATNVDDFDLRISASTPHGHIIPLNLTVTASSGGPWQETANLVVLCGGPLYLSHLPIVLDQALIGGFDSQFAGSAPGWQPVTGAWWIENTTWFTGNGLVGAWASAGRAESFADLDYQVSIWRAGCADCAHGVLIRGDPAPLGTSNRWDSGYGFYVRRGGQFSVFRYDNGISSALQNWAYSPAINVDDNWNTLRVVARGSSLSLLVNGVTVWSGSDATYGAGQVGLAFYRNASSAYDQLWVDWATLWPPSLASAAAPVSAQQQARNEQANRLAGELGPALDTGTGEP